MSKLAAMSVRAKVTAGLAVGFTALTGVTAAGALPDAAQERVESVIESVTPIEFADHSDFGQDVADDARDGGVDGQEISERARAVHQPDDPGEKGKRDEHKPDDTPDNRPTDLPTPDPTDHRDGPPDNPSNDRPGEHPTGRPDDTPPSRS